MRRSLLKMPLMGLFGYVENEEALCPVNALVSPLHMGFESTKRNETKRNKTPAYSHNKETCQKAQHATALSASMIA